MLLFVAGLTGLWLATRGRPGGAALPERAPEREVARSKPAVELAGEDEITRRATPSAPERGAPPEAGSTIPAAPRLALTFRFVGPDRGPLTLASAQVTLTDAAGRTHTRSVEDAGAVRFEGLPPQRHVARVQAPGFTHREQAVELLGRHPGDEGVVEDAVLWSGAWVAVVVQTQDGRPLRALAEALGIEPRNLLVGAFVARAFPEVLPEEDVRRARVTLPPAEFRPPPVYQQWELCESVVGALLLADPPPMWVRLELHGRPVGMEHLAPGQDEIVFRVSPAELTTGLARLRLCVLEAHSDAPVAGAKVTLRADTSAHRRRDQENVPTLDDGTLELAFIVPGRYELMVERGVAQYQDRLELAPGELRDLGVLRLGQGARVRVRVVDERGEALMAWLEIGPCLPGQRVADLFPPMLHELTDEQGRGQLALPARVSIVRAQRLDPQNMHATGQCSANLRLDPALPPAEELVLVVRDRALVRVQCGLAEARVLAIEDELGLVVLEERIAAPNWHAGVRALELARGSYRLQLRGEAGEVLLDRALELRAGAQELRLP